MTLKTPLLQREIVPLFLALLFFMAGCSALVQVSPYRSAEDIQSYMLEDARLWAAAEEFDRGIEKSEALYRGAELEAYLQEVLAALYPDFRSQMRVRVIKSTTPNAFALPNGSIYVHLGLLAALENEAQIATILAHEGVHFINRHSQHQARHREMNSGLVQMITYAGLPFGAGLVGLPAMVVATSSMAGYSRDLEREADVHGFERLTQSGYDGKEAVKAFSYLLEETARNKTPSPVFFSSHPALQERIAILDDLNRTHRPEGERTGVATYQRHTAAARLACLEEDLSRFRYEAVIGILTDERRKRLFPPHTSFHLGEAYRLRGSEGDPERSVKAYREAIAQAPGYAPPYRALGLHLMKHNDLEQAEVYLREFLNLSEGEDDRAYIEEYLTKIHRKRKEGGRQ